MTVNGSVFVTGHRGLLGSALVRAMTDREVITADRGELDLRNGEAVERFLAERRPDAIIHAAARNGGILLHVAEPVAMLEDNLAIAINVIRAARAREIPRLLYVSSACVYSGTDNAPQREECAATAMPEGRLAGYAFAKTAGVTLCDAIHKSGGTYSSIIPCNLYGPGDNYHRDHATVVPRMMRQMHETVEAGKATFDIWGSGEQTREFLHADDLAAACLLMLNIENPPARVNCGPGAGTSMKELAAQLQTVTGFRGDIVPDRTKPEGEIRPGLDCTQLRGLGWSPRIALENGLRSTYDAFKSALANGTLRS